MMRLRSRLRQSIACTLGIFGLAVWGCKFNPGGQGCATDQECKGNRVCNNGKCQDPTTSTATSAAPQLVPSQLAPPTFSVAVAPPAPSEQPTTKQGSRSTTSFFCIDHTRCKKGQLCCPGGKELCIEAGTACEPGPNGSGETSWGFRCNRFTHEPCAEDEKCVYKQAGHGPLGMTSFCSKS